MLMQRKLRRSIAVGGSAIRQRLHCCSNVNGGLGARAHARSQNVNERASLNPRLLLPVHFSPSTRKHTAARAAVWVLVVACGPVLFELPLRLPSVQIHYERSSATPASTTCDSKSKHRRTCASTRTQPECGRTHRQAGTANNGQGTRRPISMAWTSCKKFSASRFRWNSAKDSG